ncbi:MAG: hypothetical protein VX871_10545, partial [Pseudomonadota bacterium]|nr:hypothetical protein [Pseudomonadota bacterium]
MICRKRISTTVRLSVILRLATTVVASLLWALPAAAAPKKSNPPRPAQIVANGPKLPAPVARMRAAIMEAARTGDVEAMRPVLESNELKPLVSHDGPQDAIAFWK